MFPLTEGPLTECLLYYVNRHLNREPFHEQTNPHDLNTELVCYSDPQYTYIKIFNFLEAGPVSSFITVPASANSVVTIGLKIIS